MTIFYEQKSPSHVLDSAVCQRQRETLREMIADIRSRLTVPERIKITLKNQFPNALVDARAKENSQKAIASVATTAAKPPVAEHQSKLSLKRAAPAMEVSLQNT